MTEKPEVVDESLQNLPVAAANPNIKAEFRGIIVTSDVAGAGTDAGVELWLTDTAGKTVGPISISANSRKVFLDAMEKGKTDEIRISLIEDFGQLYKIAVRHDGKGANDDWHLDRIELTGSDGIAGQGSKPLLVYKLTINTVLVIQQKQILFGYQNSGIKSLRCFIKHQDSFQN